MNESGEPDTNLRGSFLNHENLILYEGLPPQGLSEARRGREFFLSHRSATGAPRRGWRHSSCQMDRVIIISASYLNNTIFMGNTQFQPIHSSGFHPLLRGFPDAITSGQVLCHHCRSRSGSKSRNPRERHQ